MYLQNETQSYKHIVDNMIFDQYGFNVQAYGSQQAKVERIHVADNFFFNLTKQGNGGDHRVLIGGTNSATSRDYRVFNNLLFMSELQLGYTNGGRDIDAKNNVVILASLKITAIENSEITNNFEWKELYKNGYTGRLTPKPSGNSPAPQQPIVFFRPNQYDRDRAHLAIINFKAKRVVDVPAQGFMKQGDEFIIKNPADFYGPPIFRGICQQRSFRVPANAMFNAGVVVVTARRTK